MSKVIKIDSLSIKNLGSNKWSEVSIEVNSTRIDKDGSKFLCFECGDRFYTREPIFRSNWEAHWHRDGIHLRYKTDGIERTILFREEPMNIGSKVEFILLMSEAFPCLPKDVLGEIARKL